MHSYEKHKTELASNPKLLSSALLGVRAGECRSGMGSAGWDRAAPGSPQWKTVLSFPRTVTLNSQQPNDKTFVLNNFLSSFSRGAMELKIKQH